MTIRYGERKNKKHGAKKSDEGKCKGSYILKRQFKNRRSCPPNEIGDDKSKYRSVMPVF